MNRFFTFGIVMSVFLSALVARAAQDAAAPISNPVTLRITPVNSGGDYKYWLELTTTQEANIVADRRLLRFEVYGRDSRRKLVCAMPGAEGRVDTSRVRQLGGGQELHYREWFDLRSYCWGKALDVVDRGGATVTPVYGFKGRRATDKQWVVDIAGSDRLRLLTGESFAPPGHEGLIDKSERLRVRMSPVDVARGGQVRFPVTVLANGESARVYVRWDLFHFHVSGPLGEVECKPQQTRIIPIVDFFQTVRGSRGAALTLDAAQVCPAGTFSVAGVYEVTPKVDLPYDGAAQQVQAVTGSYVGAATPVRVRGDQLGYVEQTQFH